METRRVFVKKQTAATHPEVTAAGSPRQQVNVTSA